LSLMVHSPIYYFAVPHLFNFTLTTNNINITYIYYLYEKTTVHSFIVFI